MVQSSSRMNCSGEGPAGGYHRSACELPRETLSNRKKKTYKWINKSEISKKTLFYWFSNWNVEVLNCKPGCDLSWPFLRACRDKQKKPPDLKCFILRQTQSDDSTWCGFLPVYLFLWREKNRKKIVGSTNIHILIFDWLYFLRRASEPKGSPRWGCNTCSDSVKQLIATRYSSVLMEVTYIWTGISGKYRWKWETSTPCIKGKISNPS